MEPQVRSATRSPLAKGAAVIGVLALLIGIAFAFAGSPGFGTALVVAAVGDFALAGVFLAARSAWRRGKSR